jgi:hypothetical protein
MNPRQQGDLGEFSAIEWLSSRGYPFFVPIGHSPDVDLMALIDDQAVRVQVKTATHFRRGRWEVKVCTSGGNQSWNGVVKLFGPHRCDYLFVLVADGRRWFIPSSEVHGTTAILLGGPHYSEYEVDSGRPIAA